MQKCIIYRKHGMCERCVLHNMIIVVMFKKRGEDRLKKLQEEFHLLQKER